MTGRYYMASRPGQFRALPGYITKEAFGVAFRMEDAALRGMVQKAIDEMIADGAMGKISRKCSVKTSPTLQNGSLTS